MIAGVLAKDLASRRNKEGEYRGFSDLLVSFARWASRGVMPPRYSDILGRMTPSDYERTTGIADDEALALDAAVTAARESAPTLYRIFNAVILHDVDLERLIRQRSMQEACTALRVDCTPSILKALTILFIERVRRQVLALPRQVQGAV